MVVPARAQDRETCAGGGVATGRVSHAGQVKSDDPEEKQYPDPPDWEFGCETNNLTPWKK
jgi:hypothetical protein